MNLMICEWQENENKNWVWWALLQIKKWLEQYLKLPERYSEIIILFYVIWLVNLTHNKDWGKCYLDTQCLQEAGWPRWKSYMLLSWTSHWDHPEWMLCSRGWTMLVTATVTDTGLNYLCVCEWQWAFLDTASLLFDLLSKLNVAAPCFLCSFFPPWRFLIIMAT